MGQVIVKQTYDARSEVYKIEYKWSVPKFKGLSSKSVGYYTESQSLKFDVQAKSNAFYLILYPRGFNDRVKDYISLWLKRTSTDEQLIQLTCALLDAKDKEIHKKSIKQTMNIESHLGWATFCRQDIILDNESTILSDGNLILNCTLEIFNNNAIMNAEIEDDDPNMNRSLSEMSTNFNSLLLESTFYDVTLIADGKALKAHKAILSARSPVFKSMMKSPLQAKANQIKITDISKEVIEEMLHYMYSGKVRHLDVQTAMKLYYASDKYEMLSLRNICTRILKSNFDASNAIDILVLAQKHSDNDLKYASIQFVAENATEIQERTEWSEFIKGYPELAIKIFKHLTSRKNHD